MSDTERVERLLAAMSLEEKLGQMQQCHGEADEHEAVIRRGGVGSFLNVVGAEAVNRFQKIAVEDSPRGIPLVFGRDVIHGFRTIFPIPLGQAASFRPDTIREGARVAAREAAALGVNWTFAPMVDIARDPRWGRIAESLGEDPHLASLLGRAMVEGFQGEALSDAESLAACAKHYVGYGAAEGGRDYNTTIIDEASLRDVYLPPFRACCDAGAATVMSAFNDLNGVPATGNAFTIRQILKGEWAWPGMVVSDWASVTEMIVHGFCADEKETAWRAVDAGVDMEMVSAAVVEHAQALLDEGKLSMAQIDDAVRRILRFKEALGLFDNPYAEESRASVLLSKEHLDAAHRAARESCVLLENDGLLPLDGSKTVALIGPLADKKFEQLGCWTMDQDPEDSITPRMALQERLGDKLLHAPGLANSRDTSTQGFQEAILAAKKADVAILVLGEDAILSGEAHCRVDLGLPGAQQALLDAIADTGTPTAVVIMAGRPLVLGAVAEKAKALLFAWHPGTMAGPALADLLLGDISPSGRLPVSFPRHVGQVPIYYNKKNTGRPASETNRGIPVGTPLDPEGFVSGYLDCDPTPQYPFGYGLTYSSFAYGKVELSSDSLKQDTTIRAGVTIQNTGEREAVETAQLYIRDVAGSRTRPVRELKGFRKVALKPGEETRVEFEIEADMLAFHGLDMARAAEPGRFLAGIGPDSRCALETEFVLE